MRSRPLIHVKTYMGKGEPAPDVLVALFAKPDGDVILRTSYKGKRSAISTLRELDFLAAVRRSDEAAHELSEWSAPETAAGPGVTILRQSPTNSLLAKVYDADAPAFAGAKQVVVALSAMPSGRVAVLLTPVRQHALLYAGEHDLHARAVHNAMTELEARGAVVRLPVVPG